MAVAGDDEAVVGRVEDLVLAVRTHIDITQRVLYPMVRRVGGDEGELLADAAEHHERALLRLVDHIDREAAHRHLRDIGGEMHTHAHLEDEVIVLLRHHLDPIERSNLPDGLAAARATSTVSLLHRTATTAPASASGISRPRPVIANGAPARPPEPAPEPRSARTPSLATSAIQKVLVGVDGSPAASTALGWAGRLAARIGAEVVVGNVFEPEQAEISPDDFERLFAEAGRRLDTEWSEPLRGSGVSHRGLQLVGAPDRLSESVEAESADLLVVGPRGAGRFASLHLGSLAHHLAHRTRGPLAIVPATGATAGMDRILVAVDGSAGSDTAVEWCVDLASATGAEVIAEISPSASAIVDIAAANDVGLLVVGTQGLNELTHRRLPLQLVHHTSLPVILVPPLGDDDDHDQTPGANILQR